MLCNLLQESANQILSLSTKTLEEMKSDPLTGPLYIGTGQTDNLSEIVKNDETLSRALSSCTISFIKW